MSIIIGGGTSRFIIAGGDIPTDTIVDLPLTDSNGLTETYITRQIKNELIGLDISNMTITQSQTILGYQMFWRFSFSHYVKGETLLKIQQILDGARNGRDITLIPRSDQPSRGFRVIYTGDTFDIGVGKGGTYAWRNRLPIFTFESKNLITDLQWSLVPLPNTNMGIAFRTIKWIKQE